MATSANQYNLIAAHSFPELGIGLGGALPWSIPDDLKYFNQLTSNNIVIMGRQTWDSLPVKYRPLPNRINIILTNQKDKHHMPTDNFYDNPIWTDCDNVDNVVTQLIGTSSSPYPGILSFIIGGAQIYQWALHNLDIQTSYITEVFLNEKKNMDSFDTFFPKYDPNNWGGLSVTSVEPIRSHIMTHSNTSAASTTSATKTVYYRFIRYSKLDDPETQQEVKDTLYSEYQYLDIMRKIMLEGLDRPDRTGTGTLSIFGTQQKYDLSKEFPMTTTKRISLRWIFEELMLYITGRTDNKILQKKGIHIWDGNTSREFLDKRGLQHYPEGDMGETYGFNMRHYGGDYQGCDKEYVVGQDGYDQLGNVLHLIRTDPTSRRMIINLWNPATGNRAALPSCLMMYQFYVDTVHHRLDCQIYIRSSDYFLANSWNACTGALLVHLICGMEGIDLTPGTLTVVTGDTHLYKTHLEQVATNLERQPYLRPQLFVTPHDGRKILDMRQWQFDDLRLVGYRAYPSIPAPMAV